MPEYTRKVFDRLNVLVNSTVKTNLERYFFGVARAKTVFAPIIARNKYEACKLLLLSRWFDLNEFMTKRSCTQVTAIDKVINKLVENISCVLSYEPSNHRSLKY